MPWIPPNSFAEIPVEVKYYDHGVERPVCCQDWLMWLRTASAGDQLIRQDDYFKHTDTHREKVPKIGNGLYQGPFAFTLTKSPKDPLTVGDMLTAVRKIMVQKSQPVKYYAWYYEDKGRDAYGDPIHPHIHGMYETQDGKRIEAKHFKRAWKVWDPSKPIGQGFQGGYHRPVKYDEAYSAYIKKDGGMSESVLPDQYSII